MLEPNDIDNYFDADVSAQKASWAERRHLTVITFVKLILPVIAAVLALTLLLLPSLKKDISEFAIDFMIPEGDIEKMNIEKTVLYLTDAKGRVNNFTAQVVKETEAGSKIYDITMPDASLPIGDKEMINIRSSVGIYNQNESSLTLPHKVELFYSRGFDMETRDFFYDFDKAVGYSNKPVIGSGFLGHLNSEGIEVRDGGNVLVFKGKTMIIIDEESLKGEKE